MKASPKASTPVIPVAWGELFDKITILEIKQRQITNPSALSHITEELAQLSAIAASVHVRHEIAPLISELRSTNEALWVCEDRIRGKEKQHAFDDEFIELARSIYLTNDKRAALKRQISVALGSLLVEEKSYGD